MNYFKKIIKKWKLIKNLEEQLTINNQLRGYISMTIFNGASSFDFLARCEVREELRNEYYSLKKALNKLHKL